MDRFYSTESTTVESTPEIPTDGLPHAIIAEVERLESEHFNNNTVMGESLLFNHTRCDSLYFKEMLPGIGPEFPTLELGARFSDKTSTDCENHMRETNPNRVSANFVEQIREDIIPIENDSIGLSAEFVAMLNQLQRRWDMVMRTNSDLKSQVTQQQQMILDLQKNNLELGGQVMQQHQIIFELRKQLNVLIEMHRLNLQISTGESIKQQVMVQIDQQPAAELSDRRQTKIAEVETVATNERSLITDCGQRDQLQVIECAQSSTADEAKTQSDSEEIGQSEHEPPSPKEDNFSQSHGSLRMKQVRSAQIREGGEKRIKFNLETIKESPENARNSGQQSMSYTCGECKKQFDSKYGLTRHSRIHTGEKPYECGVCNAAFNNSNHLKRHQRIHTGEKPYECKVCNATFTNSSDLKRHQRIHSGGKPYECEVCNATFSHSSNLRAHERTHSGEKPYECQVCKAAFSSSSNLRAHERTHSGEKPYECKVCNAAFTSSGDLKKHQRIHSGEKPHKCEVCNAAFNHSSNLTVHQRTHSDNKPFSCDICKKSFREKTKLSRHMDIHSGKKSHKCNECLKEFRDRSKLRRHVETHSQRRSK